MKKVFLLSLVAFALTPLLTGCESLRYAPYQGSSNQDQSWPTGTSFTDQVYDVPVFRGWPPKSFNVLGHIEFNKPGVDWNQGDIKQAAKMAKAAGGEALLMLANRDTVSPGVDQLRQSLSLTSDRTVAVVLQWKDRVQR